MTDKRKGWNITQSFTDDFVDAMMEFKKKYGDDIFYIQGIANNHMDLAAFSKKFFNKSATTAVADVTVDANANVSEKNIMQYNYESNKALLRLNSLYQMYKWVKKFYGKVVAKQAIEKIISGELFCNDLHFYSTNYCYSFDLDVLVREGMTFFKGNMPINVPKRTESFIALTIQSVAYISNQIAGASAFPNFFIFLDWFYQKDYGKGYMEKEFKKNKKHFTNQWQNLIYSLCFPFRGSQSPFSNFSIMDKGFLNTLFGDYVYPDGKKPDIDSIYELSKAFFEYFEEINGNEGIFTFPVMTMAISLDDKGNYLDPVFVDWVAKVNSRKALANIFQSEPNAFSSCCRLVSNLEDISALGYQNSLGVSGVSVGSHRVVGLNLPRIALLEKDNPNILEENVDLVCKILISHRRLIQDKIDRGYLPLFTTGWMQLSKQYSTVGFVGAYEYVCNKGLDIKTDEGLELLKQTMGRIEKQIKIWQNKTKEGIFNVEQIPAESVSVRLAEIDNVLGYNKENHKLYSNQYIPLTENASIYDRLRIQGEMDNYTSGGAIMHLNVEDEKPLSEKQFRNIIKAAKENGTVYFAVNYAYSECEKKHYSVGKNKKCPICKGEIVQQYTRVVGFITPVSSWNKTRRTYEYPNRVFYNNEQVEKLS